MKNSTPQIMGIVNVTPDSFSDGGAYVDPDKAIAHALLMIDQGADILDIGGESTRPGAIAVAPEEEQKRIIPVIKGIKQERPQAVISVDTRHASTMERALGLGVDIINDVSALTHDPRSMDVVASSTCKIILMHAQGSPQTMQNDPSYEDVITDIYAYLLGRVDACIDANIDHSRLILDPGIGFGKRLEDNLKILKEIDKFKELGCPLLLGTSRKSFIQKICHEADPSQRIAGSLASVLYSLRHGVDMVRVHDVADTIQAIKVWQAIEEVI